MKRKYPRIGFTAAQSAELWERWRKGEGLKSIGRALGKPSSCIFAHIRPSGGIMPSARRRSRLALTLAEREEISRGLVADRSVRAMARALGRSPSTVSREIGRNDGSGRYRAAAADKRAWKQALRPKPCKLAVYDQLRQAAAAQRARKLQKSGLFATGSVDTVPGNHTGFSAQTSSSCSSMGRRKVTVAVQGIVNAPGSSIVTSICSPLPL